MSIQATGFWGTLRGMEGHLFEVPPVVWVREEADVDDGAYVCSALNWSLQDGLVPLDNGNSSYVRFFGTETKYEIQEGATVWLAGPEFFSRLSRLNDASEEKRRVGRWSLLPSGFRYVIGHRRDFEELRNKILNRVRPALHRSLFDPLEKSNLGEADEYFALFEALTISPTRDDLIDRAIFFKELRYFDKFEFLREEAVLVNGQFSDANDFDQALSKRSDWLSETRLSDRGTIFTPESHLGGSRSEDVLELINNQQRQLLDGLLRSWLADFPGLKWRTGKGGNLLRSTLDISYQGDSFRADPDVADSDMYGYLDCVTDAEPNAPLINEVAVQSASAETTGRSW